MRFLIALLATFVTLVTLVPLVAAWPARGVGDRAVYRFVWGERSSADVPSPRALTGAYCAEPGNADRAPVGLGPAIHIAYAIPSDAPDLFSSVGPSIAADVEAIEAWWRREDPGRVPRFDRYRAPCGLQLDVTRVRLSETTRYYERFAVQTEMILEDLERSGLESDSGIQLVYYGGPIADPDVCGAGAGDPEQMIGHTVVFLAHCTDRDRARIATHEILHTLGALPTGARHPCPGDEGHPCDGDRDVLWPKVDLRSLEETVLDLGHDDYYGHAGRWDDVRDSAFLRRLDEPQTRLSLAVAGRGTVGSSRYGLSCRTQCATRWDARITVTIDAEPDAGMRFVGWRGACEGKVCRVPLRGAPVAVTAVFAPPTYPLALRPTGSGSIRGENFVCAATCIRDVPSFKRLRLRAVPRAGWRFARWSGACAGVSPTCALAMNGPETAHAVFVRTA